jgi:rhodanese-related sulfurtransferase
MTGSLSERGLPDPTYMAQMDRMRQGLRIAGLREHAEEDADFGVASDGTLQLHRDLLGLTPRAILGATTIRTAELADLLAHREPVLIDVARRPCGRSLPGAIGLQGTGYAAAFSDPLQARFRRKIHELTHADRSTLIIACCANSEHFSSYNLVLRLLALGYTQVYWYRGGWEAWQVAGLPDTPLELQEWSTG